jgi:hypothetical protein
MVSLRMVTHGIQIDLYRLVHRQFHGLRAPRRAKLHSSQMAKSRPCTNYPGWSPIVSFG